MVYEFPEVQGVMGRYYALNDKEEGSVALALEEQYLPRYAGDRLPSDLNAVSLALAEKIDTLVGIFGIGMIPKGDKDPFALRRAAIGLLRIATEGKHEFSFADVIGFAVTLFDGKLSNESTAKEVIQFVMGRCNAFYSEKSIPINVIQAVLACESSSLLNVDMRIAAVSEFSQLAESASLAAANKRVANILSKNSYSSEVTVNESLLLESEERALFDAISALNIDELSELRHYQSLLSQLAGLKDIIDGFFDNVMVMADDEEIKNNRLCLLASMRRCFLMVADIALLD
jgi:glycyl-tRNA synthetase beta chain